MTFKDAYQDDLQNTYFDLDEFAEEHTIDGESMTIVKTEVNLTSADTAHNNVFGKRSNFNPREINTNKNDILLYIRAEDAKRQFTANSIIRLDGVKMLVKSVKKEPGMIILHVGRNQV